MSLASAEAARARREAATSLGYYNLKTGPAAWRLTATLGLEWNDNVHGSDSNPLSDFIFSPGGNARMLWAVTDHNAISLSLGGGYAAYVQHPALSRVFIDPGSELSFDIYAGNVVVNLHDRFSINQFSYQDPSVAGADYSRLENALGPSVLWDLNKVVLRAGYDHLAYTTLTGGQAYPDGQSEMLYATVGYKLSDEVLAGIEGGGGTINYSHSSYPEAVQWNSGVFSEATVSDHLSLRGSAGYAAYAPGQSNATNSPGDVRGMYFQVSANHRLNRYVTHSILAGRTINFAFFGGSVDRFFVRWTANWNVLAKTSLGSSLDYQTGREQSGFREHFDWIGGGISFRRQLTRAMTGSLAYNRYWRQSDLPARGYTVNSLLLQLTYGF